MEIRFATNNDLKFVEQLSKKFAEENCCNAIVADSVNFLKGKQIAVAIESNKIIGYGYGTIEFATKNKDYIYLKSGHNF